MRFEEAYEGWTQSRFTQEEAARLLGVSDRSFRRYICQYKEEGLNGLLDKRLGQISHQRAPVNEIIELKDLYQSRYFGWNVKHFFSFYKRKHGGARGYTWVKKTLQKEGLVIKSSKRGKHLKKRQRSPLEGMMLHQDGSDHEWVPEERWDLIVTMDDATSKHYSMFFVEEEGTASSFQGMKEVIQEKGLCCSLYTDRGSHYWLTPEVGGAVDKERLTQFGRAMHQLGIEMIPAYSPEARGRSERVFRTQFSVSAPVEGSAFVPWVNGSLDNILCEQYERTVSKDNCIRFEGLVLQIPKDQHRCHYVKAKVRIHRYVDGQLAIFHGPRKLADYDSKGELKVLLNKKAA